MISCGDNWRLGVDAAVDASKTADAVPGCDCPAAEPPLAGRLVVFSIVRTIPANGRNGESRRCESGMQLISGSCTVDNATTRANVTLEQSGTHSPDSWNCEFHNYEPFSVLLRVSAICLKLTP